MNLKTKYLGLELKNPIIIGSSGLSDSVEGVKRLAENNAGAVVLKSLFEEQIMIEAEKEIKANTLNHPGAEEYIEGYTKDHNVSKYLSLIKDSKNEVDIPVIASINCFSDQDWTYFAKKIQEAGADALELNLAILPSIPEVHGEEHEQVYFRIIQKVKNEISIPIALKMSHYSAGLASLIQRLSYTGNVNGFTLFNRYYKPDIDIDALKVISANTFSSPQDISETLRWVAILSDKIESDIAASTGVHDGSGVIKQILAGANAVQLVSTIYKNGPEYISKVLDELSKWMEKKNYSGIDDFRGIINYDKDLNAAVFERTQFMKYYSGIN